MTSRGPDFKKPSQSDGTFTSKQHHPYQLHPSSGPAPIIRSQLWKPPAVLEAERLAKQQQLEKDKEAGIIPTTNSASFTPTSPQAVTRPEIVIKPFSNPKSPEGTNPNPTSTDPATSPNHNVTKSDKPHQNPPGTKTNKKSRNNHPQHPRHPHPHHPHRGIHHPHPHNLPYPLGPPPHMHPGVPMGMLPGQFIPFKMMPPQPLQQSQQQPPNPTSTSPTRAGSPLPNGQVANKDGEQQQPQQSSQQQQQQPPNNERIFVPYFYPPPPNHPHWAPPPQMYYRLPPHMQPHPMIHPRGGFVPTFIPTDLAHNQANQHPYPPHPNANGGSNGSNVNNNNGSNGIVGNNNNATVPAGSVSATPATSPNTSNNNSSNNNNSTRGPNTSRNAKKHKKNRKGKDIDGKQDQNKKAQGDGNKSQERGGEKAIIASLPNKDNDDNKGTKTAPTIITATAASPTIIISATTATTSAIAPSESAAPTTPTSQSTPVDTTTPSAPSSPSTTPATTPPQHQPHSHPHPHPHPIHQTNNPKYKSELCKNYLTVGSCPYSSSCQFAHSESELRVTAKPRKFRTQKCKNWAESQSCPYAHRCCYLHILDSGEQDVAQKMFHLYTDPRSEDKVTGVQPEGISRVSATTAQAIVQRIAAQQQHTASKDHHKKKRNRHNNSQQESGAGGEEDDEDDEDDELESEDVENDPTTTLSTPSTPTTTPLQLNNNATPYVPNPMLNPLQLNGAALSQGGNDNQNNQIATSFDTLPQGYNPIAGSLSIPLSSSSNPNHNNKQQQHLLDHFSTMAASNQNDYGAILTDPNFQTTTVPSAALSSHSASSGGHQMVPVVPLGVDSMMIQIPPHQQSLHGTPTHLSQHTPSGNIYDQQPFFGQTQPQQHSGSSQARYASPLPLDFLLPSSEFGVNLVQQQQAQQGSGSLLPSNSPTYQLLGNGAPAGSVDGLILSIHGSIHGSTRDPSSPIDNVFGI